MSPLLRIVAASFVCALFLTPAPSKAQDIDSFPIPVVELSAGYAYMREMDSLVDSYPAGWYVAGAANLTHRFGLVLETGASYGSYDSSNGWMSESIKYRTYTLMGGPRVFGKATARIVPFGQVLAGLVHRSDASRTTFLQEPDRGTHSGTLRRDHFALQPGGGVTVYVARRVALRVEVDYRWVLVDIDENMTTGQFRMLAGATYHWGSR